MRALRELQREFGSSLWTDETSGVAGNIRVNGLTAERRIQIYRNNVFSSLTEALRAVFPVVEKLVGDGFFRYASHEFIVQYPSASGNLHEFGGEFADFLADFAPAKQLTYLPDVARLEWAQNEVYHAAAPPALDTLRLASIDPEGYHRLHFGISPAARLLQSDYPVVRIWEVNQAHFQGDATVDLSVGGVYVLVLRQNLEIEFHPLTAPEYEFLSALHRGLNLGDSVDAARSLAQGFDLNNSLIKYVENQTLVEFWMR